MLETMRWHPVVPLGWGSVDQQVRLPHMMMADDVYKRMYISKATTVRDVRAMIQDPECFLDPDTFDPGRYLSTPGICAHIKFVTCPLQCGSGIRSFYVRPRGCRV